MVSRKRIQTHLPDLGDRPLFVVVDYDGATLADDFPAIFAVLCEQAKVPKGHIINIVLVESDQMRALKKEHFHIEADTDVIAFPVGNSLFPSGCPALAGEIFLGIPQILKNAQKAQWSFSEEFLFVLSHGILHVQGWEDDTDEKRQTMFKEQERMLAVVAAQGFSLKNVITLSREVTSL